jgi:hypothetical protein
MRGVAADGGSIRVHQGETGGKYFAIVNGKAGEECGLVDQFVLSADASVYAYRISRNRQSFVIVNGVAGEAFGTVDLVRFAKDGKTVTYQAQAGGLYYTVMGTQKASGKSSAEAPLLSVDGKTVVTTDYKSVTVNGTPGEVFQSVQEIEISLDGSAVAYVANLERGRCVVHNGVKGEVYSNVDRPLLSADGKVCAYHARRDKEGPVREHFVVVDGKPGEVFEDIESSTVRLSADGGLVMYRAGKINERVVVINDRKSVPMTSVAEMILSPDGKTAAYAGWIPKQYYVGGPGPKERLEPGVSEKLRFSPDGRVLTYRVVTPKKKMILVAGNARSAEFDQVWEPRFSADGKKVGFGARNGQELRWEIMDVK